MGTATIGVVIQGNPAFGRPLTSSLFTNLMAWPVVTGLMHVASVAVPLLLLVESACAGYETGMSEEGSLLCT